MGNLRVGICGYGGLGRLHVGNLMALDGIEIVAICDSNPKQLEPVEIKTNLGNAGPVFDIRRCRTYTDFRKMLKRETLDAIIAALPTDLHARYATMAMRAGLHVFSEKPMALTVRECDQMIQARDANKVQLQIGQCLRFWPEYEALRHAVQSGQYGKLESLVLTRIGSYATWGDWFNDGLRSGGAILDLHLHDVDWAHDALGMPDRLTAAGTRGRTGKIDDLTALWQYDGLVVTLRCSWKYQAFTMSFQAIFEKACMDCGMHPDPALRVNVKGEPEFKKVDLPSGNGYAHELRHFFDCVRGKTVNTRCTAESTRRSVELVMLENKAIAKQKWIKTAQK